MGNIQKHGLAWGSALFLWIKFYPYYALSFPLVVFSTFATTQKHCAHGKPGGKHPTQPVGAGILVSLKPQTPKAWPSFSCLTGDMVKHLPYRPQRAAARIRLDLSVFPLGWVEQICFTNVLYWSDCYITLLNIPNLLLSHLSLKYIDLLTNGAGPEVIVNQLEEAIVIPCTSDPRAGNAQQGYKPFA